VKPEDQDEYLKFAWFICVMMFIVACLLAMAKESNAAPGHGTTSCDEWATMTQILVLRWQGDPKFAEVDNNDAKAELSKTMNGHPELPYALTWVDYAWQNREGNPVHVWQAAKAKCEGGSI
jgi:hypothetical protein